jgi:hypothetical protein
MNEDQEFIEYEKFSERMEKSYPKMYAGKYGGFAVGKGWYPIIERLSKNIQQHLEWKNRESEVVPQVVVEQIKEKFGGLRFYYQGGDDNVAGMVRMAEAWADTACEECGGIGKRRGGGWVRTLCDLHEQERNIRIEEQAKKDGLEL